MNQLSSRQGIAEDDARVAEAHGIPLDNSAVKAGGSAIDDGGSAFPTHHGNPRTDPRSQIMSGGMSIRDHFAGQAIIALLNYKLPADELPTIVAGAYRVADAMLAERAKGRAPSMDKETIQTLLDLLNPLYGALDKRTMDLPEQNYPADFSREDEFDVLVTRGMERDLTQAVSILQNRLHQ